MTQQYPGSPLAGVTPSTGQARRVPQPVAPVTGFYNNSQTTEPATATGTADKQPVTQVTVEAAVPDRTDKPVAPAVGSAAHTPLNTPLGVHPHFKTPTQVWSWDYGNS
jgi:hypothetical protein